MGKLQARAEASETAAPHAAARERQSVAGAGLAGGYLGGGNPANLKIDNNVPYGNG